MSVHSNIVYWPSAGKDALKHRLDVYVPENRQAKAPVVLYCHGGSWRRGEKSKARINGAENVANWFVDQGFVVVAINYRLAKMSEPHASRHTSIRCATLIRPQHCQKFFFSSLFGALWLRL
jgi:acetyl esterase/lipase